MTIGILGKKLGMTQLFREDGTCVPVTVIQAGPCKVLQVKTKAVDELPDEHRGASQNLGKKRGKVSRPRRPDGYYAVQLGFDPKPERRTAKPELGHLAKSGSGPLRFVRELRFQVVPKWKQGDEVKVDTLDGVPKVDVTGITKGRGFTGHVKRHNFSRQGMSHGNSKHHRKPGSIGRAGSISKGVAKGKKMAGHYGVERVTIRAVDVVKIDSERNLLYVRGAVPGHINSYLIVRRSPKSDIVKKAMPPMKEKKRKG
jgi:large subunit ribosomal protein L3